MIQAAVQVPPEAEVTVAAAVVVEVRVGAGVRGTTESHNK